MRDVSRYIAATILYASTLYGATNHILLLIIPLVFLNFKTIEIEEKHKDSFMLIMLISVLSVLNNVAFTLSTGTIPSLPYVPLMILSFFFVQFLNDRVMRFILILVVIEVIVAAVEYVLGISTIFTGSKNYVEFTNAALYYRKVAGLSDTSSVLSYKILIGFFITHFLLLDNKYKKLLYLILLSGVVFSFNRTVVLASLFFLFCINVSYIKQQAKKPIVLLVIFFFLIYLAIFVMPTAVDYLIEQLARGDASKGVDLSSRTHIWNEYIKLIINNPILGTGSYKVFVEILVSGYEGVLFHAHNSIIMLFATQGFIIALLHFMLIALNLTKYNILYVLTVFIYSLAQYGVFWGLSFLDVFLFYFLFSSRFNQDKGNCVTVNNNDFIQANSNLKEGN